MDTHRRRAVAVVGAVVVGATLVASTQASASSSLYLSDVAANAKTPGFSAPNVLSPQLAELVVAQGANALENPTAAIGSYGYDADGPFVALPGGNVEAHKTEPDKNTYLVLHDQRGKDPAYDYGSHFLFQGHETGSPGYITRINLDADGAHRVTLLATKDSSNANLPNFDGSTWDPWAKRLLMTAENGNKGGVWQATLDVPSTVDNLSNVLGKGGYEGIQNDDRGNVYIVEDSGGNAGGSTSPNTKASKRPNSYIYRFLGTNL